MRTIFLLLILIPLVFTETLNNDATVTNTTSTDEASNTPAAADSTTTTEATTDTAAQNTTTADTTAGTTANATSTETQTATPTPVTPQGAALTSTPVPQFTGPAPTLYGGLILPYVRASTTFNVSNTAICGGTTKDKVHFMTSQSVLNEFRWYIETPFTDSYCIFRITENLDQTNDTAYLAIPPKNRNGVRADGSFPCGRTAGADYAMFDIPDEIDCDACVLEWIWSGPNFQVRQCSDITVMSGEDATCLGTCLNGGMCRRGVCVCPSGYTGDNCQYSPGAIIKSFKKIFIIIGAIVLAVVLILVAVALLSWCADKRIKEGERDQRYHTNKKYLEFDGDAPNQPSGVDQPAGHLRAEPRSGY